MEVQNWQNQFWRLSMCLCLLDVVYVSFNNYSFSYWCKFGYIMFNIYVLGPPRQQFEASCEQTFQLVIQKNSSSIAKHLLLIKKNWRSITVVADTRANIQTIQFLNHSTVCESRIFCLVHARVVWIACMEYGPYGLFIIYLFIKMLCTMIRKLMTKLISNNREGHYHSYWHDIAASILHLNLNSKFFEQIKI